MDITCDEIERFALEASKLYSDEYALGADRRAKEILRRDSSLLGEPHTVSFLRNLRNGKRLRGGRNGHVVSFGSIIIKTGLSSGRNDMDHEALIGLLGTNNLQLDAFSLVCDYIRIPVFPEDNNINNSVWMSNKQTTNAVVYENISGSLSFTEYSKTCNVRQMCSALMQIFLSLRQACREIDFTHYDLHPDNCLIKIRPSRKQITIDNVPVTCYDSPKIIDYGTSHVKLNGSSYGTPTWSNSKHSSYNISSYRSNPMHDVFKLVTCLYMCCSEENRPVLDVCVGFFTRENIDLFVEMVSRNHYTFPRQSDIQDMNTFIDYCTAKFGDFK